MSISLLFDGREFVAGRKTGIGRFLHGLLMAISEVHPDWKLRIAMTKQCALPASLRDGTYPVYLPHMVEAFWPSLAKGSDIFISPYPKLPLHPLPCPSIHTVHDVLYIDHPVYRSSLLRVAASRFRLLMALRWADMTWFDSRVSQQACSQLAGRHIEGNVRYPAVEATFSPAETVWDHDDPYFLYVGNGLPHKNLAVILRAIEHIPARLLCVGVKGEFAEKYRSDFGSSAEKIEFRQGVQDEELVQLYRKATALLLPSTAEGYGYPSLEAMACGTPAIVSNIPVLQETTGGKAVYCPPHEVSDWVDAMKHMLDAGCRQEARRRGLEWVINRQGNQGWKAHITDIEQLLERG